MARGAKKTAQDAAPVETGVGTQEVPTDVFKKVRIKYNMLYYKGRFYRAGDVLKVTPEELKVLAGYVDEVE